MQAQFANERESSLHFQKCHRLSIHARSETLSVTTRVSNKSLDLFDAGWIKGFSLAQPHEQEVHWSIRFL
jgi:hypothetical protein